MTMKKFVLLLLCLAGVLSVNAQVKENLDDFYNTREEFVDINEVDALPEYPGGVKALYELMAKNITYPPICQEHGVQGQVVVLLRINKDGVLDDIRIHKSVDPYLDKEALRVSSLFAKKWKPGLKNGVPITTGMYVPFNFRLGN